MTAIKFLLALSVIIVFAGLVMLLSQSLAAVGVTLPVGFWVVLTGFFGVTVSLGAILLSDK